MTTPTSRAAVRSPESLNRVLTRVSDAPLRGGNRLTLLRNGPEAYEEWLEEIARARRWVHLENYIFKGDNTGRRFAEALKGKAREGVPTRVLYDWYGSMATRSSFWRELREAGVDVREFNRFSVAAPLEAVLRDHRKSLSVDGEYASVGGVCIADEWVERSPKTGLPYRDTAMGIRGPAVADVERAFKQVWERSGTALPTTRRIQRETWSRRASRRRGWSCRSQARCASPACSRSLPPAHASACGSPMPTSLPVRPSTRP